MRISSALRRARFFQLILLLFILTWGCATTDPAGREWVHPIYQEKIKEWQMRIRKEGWSESQVHSILLQSRGLATYRMEIRDHWDTPKEFIRKGFTGDCEDFVAFMMGTLKRLGYPHGIRILVVRGLFVEDHALLRVEMPQGGWKVYDVVPRSVPRMEASLLKPVVEFDEKTTVWYPSQARTFNDSKETNPHIAGGQVVTRARNETAR